MENQVSSLGQGKRPAPGQTAAAAAESTKGAVGGAAHEPKRVKHEAAAAPRRTALEPLVEVPNAPVTLRLRASSPITPAVGTHGETAPAAPVAGAASAGDTDGAAAAAGRAVPPPQGAAAPTDAVVVFRDRLTAGVEAGIAAVSTAAEGATVTPARPPTVPGTGRRHAGRSPIAATAAPVKACVRPRVPGVPAAAAAAPSTSVGSPSPNAPAVGSPVVGDTDQRHAAGGASPGSPRVGAATADDARCAAPEAVRARQPRYSPAAAGRLAAARAAAGAAGPQPPGGAAAPHPPRGAGRPAHDSLAAEELPVASPNSTASATDADGLGSPDAFPADSMDDDLDAVGESPLQSVRVGANGVPRSAGGAWVIVLGLSPDEADANQAMLEVQRQTAAAGPATSGPWMALPNNLARRTRIITVDWVMEVCAVFHVGRLGMYTAVSLIDRVLAGTQVDLLMIQLVAVTSVFVASKLHDSVPIEIGQAVAISADAYTEAQVLEMERYILRITKWNVIVPNAFTFFPHLVRAGLLGAGVSPAGPDLRLDVQYVAYLLSELSLLENGLSLAPPAVVSAAVIALAMGARGLPTWSDGLAAAAGVDAATVSPVYTRLLHMWRLTYTARNPETAPERIPDFLYVKYDNEEFHTPPDDLPEVLV